MIANAPTLRLHVEEEALAPSTPNSGNPIIEEMVELFPQITGWEIQLNHSRPPASTELISSPNSSSRNKSSLNIIDMYSELLPGEHCSSRQKCDSFVEAINGLLDQLQQTQDQLERLNADLATAIPVSSVQDSDGDALLSNLEKILQQGLTGLNFAAASIYLLDDATSELNLRIQVGLPASRLLAAPRSLKDAKADLEALLGNSVMISNTADHQQWNLPEQDFQSAICIAIATHSTPLGTLWLYSENQTGFSESDLAIAELVSGRISAEIEREAAIREGSVSKKIYRDIDRAKIWQQMQQPVCTPEIDQWKTAAQALHEEGIGGALCDLSISQCGIITGSVGDIQGAVFESSLGAATMRGAMRSLEELKLSPDRYLQSINNVLWNCPLGDQIGSLLHVQIEPDSGIAKWANSGQTSAVILGTGAESDIVFEGSPLGACEDELFEKCERVILPNSTLFAYNSGFQQLMRNRFRFHHDSEILHYMQNHGLISPDDIESWIQDLIGDYSAYRATPDIGFVAIQRMG